MLDLFLSQITDPLRIGLLIGLLVTMKNTEAVTGRFIPLLLGIAFVATLLPTAFAKGDSDTQMTDILVGLVSNAAIVAVLLVLMTAFYRLLGKRASR